MIGITQMSVKQIIITLVIAIAASMGIVGTINIATTGSFIKLPTEVNRAAYKDLKSKVDATSADELGQELEVIVATTAVNEISTDDESASKKALDVGFSTIGQRVAEKHAAKK